MGEELHQLTVQLGDLTLSIQSSRGPDGRRLVQVAVEDSTGGDRPVVAVRQDSSGLRGPSQAADGAGAATSRSASEATGAGSAEAAEGPSGPPLSSHRVRVPPAVLALAGSLRSRAGPLNPEARIERAYGLGLADRQPLEAIREGGVAFQARAVPLHGLRNSVFVVLSAPGSGEQELGLVPFWTCSVARYNSAVRAADRSFREGSASRGFPSEVEARAYWVGLDLGCWPAALK